MRPSEVLELNRERVRKVIARYPVRNPRIFGSAARGDDHEDSDLDILVDRIGPMTYIDLFRLEDELSHILGCSVEVFTGLKPHAERTAASDLKII